MAKKIKASVEKKIVIKNSHYMIRFALIYVVNITLLLSLTYQMGLKDSWLFALFIIALSAKFTNTKFILDNKRVYTKDEKFKFIWISWSLVWFISIISTVLLTLAFSGKEQLAALVGTFSSMSTGSFILSISLASLLSFLILYFMYGWQTQKELERLKRQDQI